GVDVGAAGACARRTARPARTIRTVEIAPVAQGRERSRPERIIDTFSESGQAGAPAGASKAALVGKPGAAYALSVDDVNRGRDAAIAAPISPQSLAARRRGRHAQRGAGPVESRTTSSGSMT